MIPKQPVYKCWICRICSHEKATTLKMFQVKFCQDWNIILNVDKQTIDVEVAEIQAI